MLSGFWVLWNMLNYHESCTIYKIQFLSKIFRIHDTWCWNSIWMSLNKKQNCTTWHFLRFIIIYGLINDGWTHLAKFHKILIIPKERNNSEKIRILMLQVTSVDVTIRRPSILNDSQVGKQKVEALLKNNILQVFYSFEAGRVILYKAIHIVYLCIVYHWKKIQVN